MGLGGHLMWTAVAKELREKYEDDYGDFKILPIEGGGNQVCRSEIFENNPNFTFDDSKDHFKMNLSNPETNYSKGEKDGRVIHRYDKHIIDQACEFYQIEKSKLKCELYFTEEEKAKVDKLISIDNFITIEPHSKTSYTPNNKYPFDKWQKIVDEFKSTTFVQIGVEGQEILDGVINLTGKMSFKEACYCIQKSKLYLGPIGGLMHGANAVGTKSVIIVTPYQHPRMACYSDNINIRIGNDVEFDKYSGTLGYNQELDDIINNHNEVEIIKAIDSLQ